MTDHAIEILDVLACDIEARPRTAPTLEDIGAHVASVRRDDGAVVIEFDSRGLADVRAFVAAETLCCSTLRWLLTEGDPLVLRIEGKPGQLDALEGLFALA